MKALICIDLQNDFIYGSLGSDLTRSIVLNVVDKIKTENCGNLIFTQDTHEENYLDTLEGKKLPIRHCISGTEGWNIIEEIEAVIENKTNTNKLFLSKRTFGLNEWSRWLSNYDEVEIIGVCTDICVVSNALAIRTAFPNMKITVDARCCAGTSIEAHDAALITMKSCQIDIIE